MQIKIAVGYLLLQFDLAANIDYEAEKIKAANVTRAVGNMKARRIAQARKDFQI